MRKIILLLFSVFLSIFIGSCSIIGFNPGGLDDNYYVLRINSYDQQKVDYVKFDEIQNDGISIKNNISDF